MSSFEGKVALVTGGASSLGCATCRVLANPGARVVVADIDEDGGREVAASLHGSQAVVEARDFAPERYRRILGVNLDGVVFGIHAALPALKQRGGAIVATASLAGLTAIPLDPFLRRDQARCGRAHALARPGPRGRRVRFNAVCPSFAETNIIAGFRAELEAEGIPIIAETVADADASASPAIV
ncbi:MAG: SDR family NAD(P)-dependent oxidoreductase [Actinomycetota bacterium]|nr:SDR family NAD(P)-dependent oxidoreductase [Actinomycetota bacterium]